MKDCYTERNILLRETFNKFIINFNNTNCFSKWDISHIFLFYFID